MTKAQVAMAIDAAEEYEQEPPQKVKPKDATERPNAESKLTELAVLSPVKYDRHRKQAAKEMGIRQATLDEEVERRRPKEETDSRGGGKLNLPTPDPWPEPVCGFTLVDDLEAALSKYLALEDDAAVAMALWVVHTHAFDAAHVTPRLALTSPEKRCGKTTALDVLSRLVAKPLSASNISPAPLFRTVELARPTLLIDEADTFLHGNDELRGILNSGHTPSGQVIRSVGDDHEPRTFKTFAPVAIAKIGGLPDTLEDRSIVIKMRRKRPDEQVAKFRLGRTPDLDTIGRESARWADDNLAALQEADPDIPKELHDRAADNWTALLAIADAIGGSWPEQARRSAVTLSSGEDADSVRATLLADIQTIFRERGTDKLASQDICDALSLMEDRPWPEWKNGKPMTPTALARQLGMFQIKPKSVRLDDGRIPKGYHRGDFEDAFARYLPSQSATPPQPKESGASSGILKRHTDDHVAFLNPPNPAENSDCDGVAFQNGDTPDEWKVSL